MTDDAKAAEQDRRDAGRDLAAEKHTVGLVMGSYEGRRWMWELLSFCGPYQSRYTGDGDALGMAWRDGRAAVGGRLLEMVDAHAPDLYLRMVREHQTRLEKQREREAAKAGDDEIAVPLTTTIERMADAQASEGEENSPKPGKKRG